MKITKPLSHILLITVGFFSLLSFNVNSPRKPVATVTYYYVSGTPFQRTKWNTFSPTYIERSIDKDLNTPPYFKRTASWTTSVVPFTPSFNLDYIGCITFDEEFTADGGSDGQLTLQEAIDAMYNAYMTTQVMPYSLVVDGNATISYIGATSAH